MDARFAEQMMHMSLGLLIVLATIFALAWLSRHVRGNAWAGVNRMRILSQLRLGVKERLMIVEIDGENMLLGVTAQSIHFIKQLEPQASQQNVGFKERLSASMSKGAS